MSTYIYYVYAYINKRTGLPYYIGKGKGRRAYAKHRRISVPKNRSMIVFMETNLSDIGALAIESRYIQWYGRKGIDKNGILLNIAPGGESGNRGKTNKGFHQSEHAKFLLSKAAKKQWASGNTNIDLVKMRCAVEQKYGVANIRELKTNCPHCGKYGQMVAMKRWHFDKCKSQSPSSIYTSSSDQRLSGYRYSSRILHASATAFSASASSVPGSAPIRE